MRIECVAIVNGLWCDGYVVDKSPNPDFEDQWLVEILLSDEDSELVLVDPDDVIEF